MRVFLFVFFLCLMEIPADSSILSKLDRSKDDLPSIYNPFYPILTSRDIDNSSSITSTPTPSPTSTSNPTLKPEDQLALDAAIVVICVLSALCLIGLGYFLFTWCRFKYKRKYSIDGLRF